MGNSATESSERIGWQSKIRNDAVIVGHGRLIERNTPQIFWCLMVMRWAIAAEKPTRIPSLRNYTTHHKTVCRTEPGADNGAVAQRRNGYICLQVQAVRDALLQQKVKKC